MSLAQRSSCAFAILIQSRCHGAQKQEFNVCKLINKNRPTELQSRRRLVFCKAKNLAKVVITNMQYFLTELLYFFNHTYNKGKRYKSIIIRCLPTDSKWHNGFVKKLTTFLMLKNNHKRILISQHLVNSYFVFHSIVDQKIAGMSASSQVENETLAYCRLREETTPLPD